MWRMQLVVNLLIVGRLIAMVGSTANAAVPRVDIRTSVEQVGKYGRIEFLLDVDASYDNPFDPEQVDLRIALKTPSGVRIEIPAFFGQLYQRKAKSRGGRVAAWMYPRGMPVWRGRFAPSEVGTYQASAVLKDQSGTARSRSVRFTCVESDGLGFLGVSRADPRYFEFSEGDPFFPIGQNLAFIGEGQYVDLAKAEEIFKKLSDNGANYLRIWTCCQDWAMAIEARKSAWGRSWHWQPPIAAITDTDGKATQRQCVRFSGDGDSAVKVEPSHAIALLPGTRYVVTAQVKTEGDARLQLALPQANFSRVVSSGPGGEWGPMKLEFTTGPEQFWLGTMRIEQQGQGTVWLDRLSLKEATGGPELLWEADVNRPVRGFYNPVDCFMLDEVVRAAEENDIYLQLCLITRDVYMNSLKDDKSPEYDQAIRDAKKLLRYAVARWGYSTNVAAWEYFNEMDPGMPTDRFYTELGEYLEQIDAYNHLRTTSTWHPSARDCRHAKLDIADVHFYLRPTDKDRLKDEVDAVLDRAAYLREQAPGKPTHLGEFGLATDKWTPTDEMKQSQRLVDFHNAMWASALSGTSGTALFWWWDRLDPRNVYPQYRPLADFLADIPWTTARLQPADGVVSDNRVRPVGLQGTNRAYFWLFNQQAAWANVVIRKETPERIDGATLTVKGLAAGQYDVQWWDTDRGKMIREDRHAVASGVLRVSIPTFDDDIACKILPR